MTRVYPFSKHYECLSCRKVSSSDEWNKATRETLDDYYEADVEMRFTTIEEAMEDIDCDTWFTCPSCEEELWNDNLQLREVSFADTPSAARYYATNEIARELLEESW